MSELGLPGIINRDGLVIEAGAANVRGGSHYEWLKAGGAKTGDIRRWSADNHAISA